MNEETWTEKWYIRLSIRNAIVLFASLFILSMVLISLAILYSPIRQYLPGYSENVRKQLVEQTMYVDSMASSLDLQRRYLDMIKQVVAGEVESDTIQSLDSMQLIMRQELLMARNEVTDEFVAEYETKEKDNLQLFMVQTTAPAVTMFRPAHGVVVRSFSAEQHFYDIQVQTPPRENLTAILPGTIIYANYEIGNTYTIIVQHAGYISVYAGASMLLKHTGDMVKAGESIALANGENPIGFSLWQNGYAINPEEFIAF